MITRDTFDGRSTALLKKQLIGRTISYAFALAATALSVACSTQPPTSAQPPSIVAQKLYDQLDQSWANHDLNQVLGFVDPRLVLVDAKGTRKGFADYRKQTTDVFDNPKLRNFNRKTTIKDVQLQAGRLVIYYELETHFQYQHQTLGWESLIETTSAETTWQRTGDQWKIVMIHVLRDNTILDPRWAAQKNAEIARKLKAIDGASSVLVPCNYSYNGCR